LLPKTPVGYAVRFAIAKKGLATRILPSRMAKTSSQQKNNGSQLGFETTLWAAADKLRGNLDAAEYKHVVLGLIFLKYISDAFAEKHAALKKDKNADAEDRDEYLADNIFWTPPEARWSYLQGRAKDPLRRIAKRLRSSAFGQATPRRTD
jgi:type I restriction-modification system DNA methylase subunit